MDTAEYSEQKEQPNTATESELKIVAAFDSQSPCDAGVHDVVDAVTPSPAGSSSDTDVEHVDVDEPVDLCRRRNVDDDAVTKLDTDALAKPVTQQMSNVTQRITTTEADDSTGLSKRKRKLRSCDKCGYVTDNLTTLQRHAAKHGSAGQ